MPYLNLKATAENTYDAIVIGSGMSGSWAAKELCEKGLKTLVLERGRLVKHVEDYPTMHMDPWDHELKGALPPEKMARQQKQSRSIPIGAVNSHFFVDDVKYPYEEKKRFDWIRGYHTGGRSIMWGRHCYRWSDLDFSANAKEGIGIDWPIRYKDIAPWYSHVERFVGISGEKLGLAHLPDGEFLKPMPLNCLEKHVRERVAKEFPGRYITIGRVANLTEPINGRTPCQYRSRCSRGCPFGAYFSAVSVTLPAAEATGNYTLRPYSIVQEIIYDADTKKATGVRIVDEETKESIEYYTKIIFCNASTVGSTAILLNSKSDRFPNGMGNDSGELGHNLMDHHFFAGATGTYEGMEDQYYTGRRPTGVYVPRFRNIDKASQMDTFTRGFGYQGEASRTGWSAGTNEADFGGDFKDRLFKPQGWTMMLNGFGECLPYHENKLELSTSKTDEWGFPIIVFDADFKENEMAMRQQMQTDAAEMLESAGFKNIETFDKIGGIGKGVHEMGTARMGNDPKTSVVNANNQVHGVDNVFVTDGACMTSSSCVNPSITYMALAARAANFAVDQLQKQNL